MAGYSWQRRETCPKGALAISVSASGRGVAMACVLALAGCASATPPGGAAGAHVPPSPKVVHGHGPVPKGGGVYKVGSPYQIGGRWYVPRVEPDYDRVGIASWYGSAFHGRSTANGEVFDMHALTAAHPTLPLPSLAYVTNVETGRTILVRINDRGPYANDRIVDLSYRVAKELGFAEQGLARVRVRYAGPAPMDGNDSMERRYLAGLSRERPPSFAAAMPHVTTGSVAGGWSVDAYRAGSGTPAASLR